MATIGIETVLAWHAALNQADVERLLSSSIDDVEVGGPRGAGHGADLLREWLARAGVHLEPRRVFCRDQVVIVEQAARWPTADGQRADPQEVASVFRVEDGRVASVLRHLDLASALHAAGLDFSDEHVPARPFPG